MVKIEGKKTMCACIFVPLGIYTLWEKFRKKPQEPDNYQALLT